MLTKSLHQYLAAAFASGIIDHSLRCVSADDGRAEFYLHPTGADGDTPTFGVVDNVLLPASKKAFSFGQAIELVKAGYAVTRAGWNGKGMFVYLQRGSVHAPGEASNIEGLDISLFETNAHAGTSVRLPCLCMHTASGATVTGWLASQTDMLAEDWHLI